MTLLVTDSVRVDLTGLRLESPNGRSVASRGAMHAAARRRRAAKEHAFMLCKASLRSWRGLPSRIEVTRVGPRPLDADNLVASAKAVLDGVAAALGVDDARFQVAGAGGDIPVAFHQVSWGHGKYAVLLHFYRVLP